MRRVKAENETRTNHKKGEREAQAKTGSNKVKEGGCNYDSGIQMLQGMDQAGWTLWEREYAVMVQWIFSHKLERDTR